MGRFRTVERGGSAGYLKFFFAFDFIVSSLSGRGLRSGTSADLETRLIGAATLGAAGAAAAAKISAAATIPKRCTLKLGKNPAKNKNKKLS